MVSARLARVFSVRHVHYAQIFLDVTFWHPTAGEDIVFIVDCFPPQKTRRKNESSVSVLSVSHVTRVVKAMSDQEISGDAAHLISPPSAKDLVGVATSVSVDSAFLASTHAEWSRIVSQTPWNGEALETDGGDDACHKEITKSEKSLVNAVEAVLWLLRTVTRGINVRLGVLKTSC